MLITAPTAEPLSLDEVKRQIGIGAAYADTTHDMELMRRIAQARQWAENYTQRSFMPQVHERRLDTFLDEILLPMPPVVSITSIKYVATDGVLTTLDAADYVLKEDVQMPYLLPAYGVSLPSIRDEVDAVRVRYATGYTVEAVGAPVTITSITKAAPGVVTAAGHGFVEGQLVQFDTTGMTELDGLLYRVCGRGNDTFNLSKAGGASVLSTLGYTTFTAGTVTPVRVSIPELIIEAMLLLIGHWTNFQSRLEQGANMLRVPFAIEQLLQSEKVWRRVV